MAKPMNERQKKAFERAKNLPKGGPLSDHFLVFNDVEKFLSGPINLLNSVIRLISSKYDKKKTREN
jgi:hypothetical protein